MRKYAVSVLALLATSLKGQVAMLCGGAAASDAVAAADGGATLDRVAAANADAGGGGGAMMRVAALLRDGMPAVVAMAASCLHKVSTLVIGAQAIVSAGLHTGLAALLLAPPSDDLLLRTHLASTLLQVYRLCPRAPRPKGVEASVTKLLSALSDRELALILLQLLDAWGVALAADALPYEVRTMAQSARTSPRSPPPTPRRRRRRAGSRASARLSTPNEAKAHSAKKRTPTHGSTSNQSASHGSRCHARLVADTSCGGAASRPRLPAGWPRASPPGRRAGRRVGGARGPARRRSADADGVQVGAARGARAAR